MLHKNQFQVGWENIWRTNFIIKSSQLTKSMSFLDFLLFVPLFPFYLLFEFACFASIHVGSTDQCAEEELQVSLHLREASTPRLVVMVPSCEVYACRSFSI